MTFTKIVVATDFSPGANMALESARSLAQQLGASLHLLHVVEDPVLAAAWTEGYAYDVAALRQALVRDAEQRLAAIAIADPKRHASTEVAIGHPVETIVQKAADRGADLIVVGSHGRSGITRVMMGSVAERVVRLAVCPVLVVHGLPRAQPEAEAKPLETAAWV